MCIDAHWAITLIDPFDKMPISMTISGRDLNPKPTPAGSLHVSQGRIVSGKCRRKLAGLQRWEVLIKAR